MEKKCAYCNNPGKMTKEHIWPKCIIERVPTYIARYSESNKTVFAGELMIKDVCMTCNNGELSKLDTYACQLYDKYFKNFTNTNDITDFVYNYDLLIRWLLKVSYNSARATKSDVDLLSKFKDYILLGGNTREDVSILAELMPPMVKENKQVIYPKSTRVGRVQLPEKLEWLTIRMVSINSYSFYLIFSTTLLEEIPENEIKRFLTKFPGQFVDPSQNKLIIRSSKMHDTHKIHIDHFSSSSEQYNKFFNKDKKD